MRRNVTCAVLAMAVMSSVLVLEAQRPTFDCAKATGEVEKLICQDAGLAALDRKLDEVYRAASGKARGQMLATLRAEQRGWVKGRNECWKAKDAANAAYLTASWQATSVHDCVEGQYKIRTSELQALYQLVTPKPVFYACQNNPANEVVATFFDTDPPTARLERGDRTATVWMVPAASGGKYEGRNVTFWTKGNEATVTWLNTATGATDELQCRPR